MKKFSILLYLGAIILVAGCGHTNELANFDLNSKTFYFEDSIAPGAKKVKVDFDSPLTVNVDVNSGKTNVLGGIFSAVAAVGSAIVSSTTKTKLENAIDASTMALYVSDGIEKTLTRYYNIKSVETLGDNPEYIVETILDKIQLGSTKEGVGVLVEATSRIIDKKLATIVWEKSNKNIIPVHETKALNNTKTDKRINAVVSAAQLADLSEEEIQSIVYEAAEGAGKLIAETLRDDISDIRTN